MIFTNKIEVTDFMNIYKTFILYILVLLACFGKGSREAIRLAVQNSPIPVKLAIGLVPLTSNVAKSVDRITSKPALRADCIT